MSYIIDALLSKCPSYKNIKNELEDRLYSGSSIEIEGAEVEILGDIKKGNFDDAVNYFKFINQKYGEEINNLQSSFLSIYLHEIIDYLLRNNENIDYVLYNSLNSKNLYRKLVKVLGQKGLGNLIPCLDNFISSGYSSRNISWEEFILREKVRGMDEEVIIREIKEEIGKYISINYINGNGGSSLLFTDNVISKYIDKYNTIGVMEIAYNIGERKADEEWFRNTEKMVNESIEKYKEMYGDYFYLMGKI